MPQIRTFYRSAHRVTFLLVLFFAIGSVPAHAQTVIPLYTFHGTDGGNSIAGLVQGRDGQLYGTTQSDGKHSAGTVFKITTGGSLVTLHHFCSKTSCADGANPTAGFILGTDGNFYGTTFAGGNTNCASGCGTVFKITSTGTLTTLHEFCSTASCDDGGNPYGSLMQATDGNLYGTTSAFGLNSLGTIFKITTAGVLTTIHPFAFSDGAAPYGSLIQATNGNFYGTTTSGGTHGDGTVFQLTTAGSLTTIHNFNGKDGDDPYAGVIETFPGAPSYLPDELWGVTSLGGGFGKGAFFAMSLAGKIQHTLSFCQAKGCTDGSEPLAAVTMDHAGGITAVASSGGTADLGSLYYSTDSGFIFRVYSFVRPQPAPMVWRRKAQSSSTPTANSTARPRTARTDSARSTLSPSAIPPSCARSPPPRKSEPPSASWEQTCPAQPR